MGRNPNISIVLLWRPGMLNKIIAFVFILSLTGAYWAWSAGSNSPIEASVVNVEKAPIESRIQVTGKVTTKRKVMLAPLVQSEVTQIFVKENDVVTSGEVLLRLDNRKAEAEVKLAQASLAQKREEYLQAQRKLKNKRQLTDLGGVSVEEIQNVETEQALAKAKVQEYSQRLEVAKIDLDNYIIKAPFAGVITRSNVYKGQRVYPGNELFVLADVESLEVEAEVDAGDIRSIHEGQKAEVSSDSFSDKAWIGSIVEIGSAVRTDETETTKKYVPVSIHLLNKLSELRIGEQVDIDIILQENPSALVLPFNAVLKQNGDAKVAIAVNGRVHYEKIVTGIESLTHTEILQGVGEGQKVLILSGSKKIPEGAKIVLQTN
jgi:membrane fusion protein, multidrug efflux system